MIINPCKNCIIDSICTIGCEKLNLDDIKEEWLDLDIIIKRIITNKFNEYKIKTFNLFRIYIRDNSLQYRKNGHLHRDGDKPAIIRSNGTIEYYKNGKLHREGDIPTIIYPNGTVKYFKNGYLHRDGDNPTVIYPDGTVYYYKNGKRHRDGNKPAVIYPDGTVEYWMKGKSQ